MIKIFLHRGVEWLCAVAVDGTPETVLKPEPVGEVLEGGGAPEDRGPPGGDVVQLLEPLELPGDDLVQVAQPLERSGELGVVQRRRGVARMPLVGVAAWAVIAEACPTPSRTDVNAPRWLLDSSQDT
ncbi:hypothetical protein [Kitasatospora kazusensis]|uniref:hypothetical protein n=1 Tax=Kitasatospora kazusensis TaxID=407974 RepID=UPI0031D4C895